MKQKRKYFTARKGAKVYMPNPIRVSVRSITTLRQQDLFPGDGDCAEMKDKRIVIVDDEISTGESLHTLEEPVKTVGGIVVTGEAAVLAGGSALSRGRSSVWPLCRCSTPTGPSRSRKRYP